ncbi:hypothetical protein DUD43_18060 [Alcaligenes faecalis]|uniref:PhaM family polyhydroxyalkanoate granule multifunctional regulatory protein n=1 Tax=Alcaligenes faecalis TaxID=511 RepID=UPI0012937DA0|nr:PhaM family polyhydroxyalkanoate granule multifunctional regulatory protein [Alcaligenes faecalis]QFY79465.1 hypothetical protein DUD43_18060 [Alcaligenes faecalis]HCB1211565.1 hypothetical protein [Klebsiella pneumoniae]
MNPNPFGIPDFNALGGGNNPLLRSMDMMAQAWKNMASGGAGDLSSGMMPSLSPDDLDRRIRDLRAVESWLQLNLSMLGTTIQGLEIQRSTLAAIKTMAQQGTQAAGGKNPFEAFMAFNPMAAGAAAADSAAAGAKPAASKPEAAAQTASQPASAQPQQAAPQPETAAKQDAPKDKQTGAQQEAGAGNPAAQAWWNMLQQQFDAMATATAASMQQVENYRQQATKAKAAGSAKPPKPAAANAQTSAKTSAPAAAKPVKTAAKAATKTAAKAATKTAAKKTATRSTPSSTKKN